MEISYWSAGICARVQYSLTVAFDEVVENNYRAVPALDDNFTNAQVEIYCRGAPLQ